MNNETHSEDNLPEIQGKANAMETMVRNTTVANDDDLREVADKIKNVKLLGKAVRSEMEKYTKPAQEIINQARLKFLPFEKMCANAEAALKAKANIYMTAQENERRAREAEIAKKLEDGKIQEKTAIKRLDNLGEEQKTVSTETSKISRQIVKEVEIVDPSLVPDEYWTLDEVKIRKVALAGVEIPGVVVKEVSRMAIR